MACNPSPPYNSTHLIACTTQTTVTPAEQSIFQEISGLQYPAIRTATHII
ncbi:MAG: hypothetical protein RLZ12_248 [Bacillota bacterium]|jgi:hypothetical protein